MTILQDKMVVVRNWMDSATARQNNIHVDNWSQRSNCRYTYASKVIIEAEVILRMVIIVRIKHCIKIIFCFIDYLNFSVIWTNR